MTARWSYVRVRGLLVREGLPFAVVGFVSFVVDVGAFNALRLGLVGLPEFGRAPLVAKVVSVSLATVTAWLGNRLWTFRRRRRDVAGTEFVAFVVTCTIGLGIALSCLGVSHYLLGWRTPLADNISANGFGLVLGATFRFWGYRRFVFNQTHRHAAGEALPDPLVIS